MKTYKTLISSTLLLLSLTLSAKDYKASLFGAKSDGITLNTGSIQYAIDYISKNGGGTLHFYVGRYLTGSFELKSNVTIEMHEGAILVAVGSIYDYIGLDGKKALITANGQENIGIKGIGVIEGQGAELHASMEKQAGKGYITGEESLAMPMLVYFNNCNNISVEDVIMQNSCGDIQSYSGCTDLSIKGITLLNKEMANSKGIVISSCNGAKLSELYFETSGAELIMEGESKNVSVNACINSKGKKIQAK